MAFALGELRGICATRLVLERREGQRSRVFLSLLINRPIFNSTRKLVQKQA